MLVPRLWSQIQQLHPSLLHVVTPQEIHPIQTSHSKVKSWSSLIHTTSYVIPSILPMEKNVHNVSLSLLGKAFQVMLEEMPWICFPAQRGKMRAHHPSVQMPWPHYPGRVASGQVALDGHHMEWTRVPTTLSLSGLEKAYGFLCLCSPVYQSKEGSLSSILVQINYLMFVKHFKDEKC